MAETRTVQPLEANHLKGTNLYLVGMMGSGKSTLGQRIAQQLGYRCFDTDRLIEQAAGQAIPELFAQSGEAAFRELETQVLNQLAPYTRLVVATGGGIVVRRQNWGQLRHGIVIWLDVPIAELVQRLQGDTSRPLLQRPDWPEHLAQILADRQRLYQEADIHLAVNPGEGVEAIAERLFMLLGDRLRFPWVHRQAPKPVD
ncbi:MAG: shikimate kinase [Cyanobacteria bacterium]|nr:shikimate kinase [Cyanobacteriota bacterium]